MFHFPNLIWTGLQAEAVGLPQLTEQTTGIKEEELQDLKRALSAAKSKFALEGIYTGALASVYQKTRVESICRSLGLDCISPLWGIDPEAHLRQLLSDGFDTVIVGVSALGLDQRWLGRRLDEKGIDELVSLSKKYRFHAGLEGGEGETFVLDCPLFKKRVEIEGFAVRWRGDSGYLEITKARLTPKSVRKT
jgi:ABC transporter with metal-binding/Fe-S-binding domain ATP-binding protein